MSTDTYTPPMTTDEAWAKMQRLVNRNKMAWFALRTMAVERLSGDPSHGIGSSDINHKVAYMIRWSDFMKADGTTNELLALMVKNA